MRILSVDKFCKTTCSDRYRVAGHLAGNSHDPSGVTAWIKDSDGKSGRSRFRYINCIIIHAAKAPPANASNSAMRENDRPVPAPPVEVPVT